MNPKRLYERIRQGSLQNVSFADFVRLIEAFGWRFDRQEGSHRVFRHGRVRERLSLLPDRNGQAKPYQIRHFLDYVDDYNLDWEE